MGETPKPRAIWRTAFTAVVVIGAVTTVSAPASAAPIRNACGGLRFEGQAVEIHTTYVVQPGDWVYQIVRDIVGSRAVFVEGIPKSQIAQLARQVIRLNRPTVRRGGNLIFPGQVLQLPATLHYCTRAA